MAKKRTEHRIRRDEIEIGPFQLQLMLGETWQEDIQLYTQSFYCDCKDPKRELVNYKSYVNDLNDVILYGWCNSCKTIAANYIEIGERRGIDKIADKIRKLNRQKD